MSHKPKLFDNMGDVEAQKQRRHDRARRIEEIVCSEYLDENTDAADLALDVMQREPFWTDEQVARHVAQLITQA